MKLNEIISNKLFAVYFCECHVEIAKYMFHQKNKPDPFHNLHLTTLIHNHNTRLSSNTTILFQEREQKLEKSHFLLLVVKYGRMYLRN